MTSYRFLSDAGGPAIVVFPNSRRTDEARRVRIHSTRDLRRLLQPVPDPGSKDDAPLIMRRDFEGGRRRANARGPALLVLDIDSGGVQPGIASDELRTWGVPHLLYTTHSHSEDEPRYRVVVPVFAETREQHEALARDLFGMMGCPPTPESWAINSGFYAPVEGCIIIDRLDGPMDWVPPVVTIDEAETDEAPSAREGLDFERARSALEATPCEDLSYEEWLQVGMELKSTGDPLAFELWDEWSQLDAGRYETEGPYSTAEKWETLSEGGGLTIASLYKRAVENGWRPPRSTAEDDFADVEPIRTTPQDRIRRAADGWPMDADQFVDEISRKFAAVNEGGAVRVYEVLTSESRIVPFSEQAFRTYMNGFQRTVEAGEDRNGEPRFRTVKMGDYWMQAGERRRFFPESTFNPNKKLPPRVFNYWRGWPWAKAESSGKHEAAIARFLDHLATNICDGDDRLYDWLRAWIAHVVQQPGQKPGTACVFRGGQGTGKSIVGLIICNMLGDYAIQVDDLEMLVGGFNAHLRHNLFVYADEISSGSARADGRSKARKLKSVITGFNRMLQPKGVDATQQPNFTRLMFSSNEEWSLLADADDRRHTVFEVGSKRANDMAYFAPLYDSSRDPGFLRDLFCYFRDLDVSGLPSPYRNVKTRGLDRQKIESLTGIEKWWYDCLCEGRLPGQEAWIEDPASALVYDLYRASVDRFQKPIALVSAVPKIQAMAQCEKRLERKAGTKRQVRLQLGSLDRCRSAFDDFIGRVDRDSAWEEPQYEEDDD